MQRRPEGWKGREQGTAVEGEFTEAGGRPRRAWGVFPGDQEICGAFKGLDQGSDHMQVLTDHCRDWQRTQQETGPGA